MTETIIRVYTGIVKTIRKSDLKTRQTGYYEIPYKEFDAETGEQVGEGTADFTGTRMCSELKQYNVQTYTGETNRAGSRTTSNAGAIRVSKNQRFPAIRAARLVYGESVARVERCGM